MVVVSEGPKAVLQLLAEKGFSSAFIAGGGKVNASFLAEGLIDEIYLDVEPLLFSKGIPVIAPVDFEYDLQLLATKKLNDNTVQLHYKVLKD
jgi:dihydrofolate reductase